MVAQGEEMVLIEGGHLVNSDSSATWCGELAVGGVAFVFEPGSDLGAHKLDCQECARLLEAKK